MRCTIKREKNNDDVVMYVEKHGNSDTGLYDTDTAPVGCICHIQYYKPMSFDLFSELSRPALVSVTCPFICVRSAGIRCCCHNKIMS